MSSGRLYLFCISWTSHDCHVLPDALSVRLNIGGYATPAKCAAFWRLAPNGNFIFYVPSRLRRKIRLPRLQWLLLWLLFPSVFHLRSFLFSDRKSLFTDGMLWQIGTLQIPEQLFADGVFFPFPCHAKQRPENRQKCTGQKQIKQKTQSHGNYFGSALTACRAAQHLSMLRFRSAVLHRHAQKCGRELPGIFSVRHEP